MLSAKNPTREELFFLAEADYMEGRLETAIIKLEKATALETKPHFNKSEKVYWCDGFQPIEGWLLTEESEHDFLSEQIEGLRHYLIGKKGQMNEAIQGLQRLIRRGDFPFHPFTHIFLYQMAQITMSLPLGERADDQLVHLSRAIEKLQSRAGRFDDQKKKLGFLNHNYWNCLIMDEAHKKKFL